MYATEVGREEDRGDDRRQIEDISGRKYWTLYDWGSIMDKSVTVYLRVTQL